MRVHALVWVWVWVRAYFRVSGVVVRVCDVQDNRHAHEARTQRHDRQPATEPSGRTPLALCGVVLLCARSYSRHRGPADQPRQRHQACSDECAEAGSGGAATRLSPSPGHAHHASACVESVSVCAAAPVGRVGWVVGRPLVPLGELVVLKQHTDVRQTAVGGALLGSCGSGVERVAIVLVHVVELRVMGVDLLGRGGHFGHHRRETYAVPTNLVPIALGGLHVAQELPPESGVTLGAVDVHHRHAALRQTLLTFILEHDGVVDHLVDHVGPLQPAAGVPAVTARHYLILGEQSVVAGRDRRCAVLLLVLKLRSDAQESVFASASDAGAEHCLESRTRDPTGVVDHWRVVDLKQTQETVHQKHSAAKHGGRRENTTAFSFFIDACVGQVPALLDVLAVPPISTRSSTGAGTVAVVSPLQLGGLCGGCVVVIGDDHLDDVLAQVVAACGAVEGTALQTIHVNLLIVIHNPEHLWAGAVEEVEREGLVLSEVLHGAITLLVDHNHATVAASAAHDVLLAVAGACACGGACGGACGCAEVDVE
mmetsp:Transcript_26681/g.76509  ORF Transcript_26681/g.76509 Transcript_26681/m.76509 type:complete len:539 (+) Transcript_26681:2082-3698(+)